MDILSAPHILAIGESLVDILHRPDRPDDVVETPGGSPANTAMTLGRLGRPIVLETWLGRDERGRTVAEHFRDSHVYIPLESFGATRTTTATATLNERGAATYTFDIEWAPRTPIPVSPNARIVHAGSISAVIRPGGPAILDALHRAHDQAIVTYDPNIRPDIMGSPEESIDTILDFVRAADIVKVSDEDIAWLTNDAPLDEVVSDWLGLGPSLVIVTRGSKGAMARSVSGMQCAATPADIPVVDTVGAGDSFTGGIIDALWGLGLVGANAREALRTLDEATAMKILTRASRISDITVSRAGANPPWLSELSESELND